MDKKKKVEWVIKYIKKNDLDYILNPEFGGEKTNWLKRHSNEIQSICSLLSVFVIGFFSLLLTFKYNNLVIMQTEVMKYEQKPNINIVFEKNVDKGIDGLTIINNGIATLSYDVEVLAYFNVMCNENQLGYFPIRVYLMDGIFDLNYNNSQIDEMVYIKVYNDSYDEINTIKSDLYKIIDDYTNLYWDFQLNYLIKVTSIDKMNEVNEDYFVYNRNGINKILDDKGINIVNEYWSLVQTEGILILKDLDAEHLFKYTLRLLREKKLYTTKDFQADEYVTYGDYEP